MTDSANYNVSDGISAERLASIPVGDAKHFAEMDEVDLMDCVVGITNRLFIRNHPICLAIREMANRFWRMAIEGELDKCADDGLIVKVGDRYFTPEHASKP